MTTASSLAGPSNAIVPQTRVNDEMAALNRYFAEHDFAPTLSEWLDARLTKRQKVLYEKLMEARFTSTCRFPVDFEDLWPILYSRKDTAKDTLEKLYEVNVEYILLQPNREQTRSGSGGHNKQDIYLTLDAAQTFSFTGRKSVKSKQYGDFFVATVKAMQHFHILDEKYRGKENEARAIENTYLETMHDKQTNYIGLIGKIDGLQMIKAGYSDDICRRKIDNDGKYPNGFRLIHVFASKHNIAVEKRFKSHPIIAAHQKDIIGLDGKTKTECFVLDDTLTIEIATKIYHDCAAEVELDEGGQWAHDEFMTKEKTRQEEAAATATAAQAHAEIAKAQAEAKKTELEIMRLELQLKLATVHTDTEEESAEAPQDHAEAQVQPTAPPMAPEEPAPEEPAAPAASSGAIGPAAPPPRPNIHADGYQMDKAKEYVATLRAAGEHPDKHASPLGGWLYNYSRGIAGKGSMKPRDDVTAYLRAELGEFWDGLVARAHTPYGTDQAAKSARLTDGLLEYFEAHAAVAPDTGTTQELSKHWFVLVAIATKDVIKAHSKLAPGAAAPRLYSGAHKASIARIKASVMGERFARATEAKRRKIPGQPAELPALAT